MNAFSNRPKFGPVFFVVSTLTITLVSHGVGTGGTIAIDAPGDNAMVAFAADEVKQVTSDLDSTADWHISFQLITPSDDPTIRAEGFHLRRSAEDQTQQLSITAIDAAGLMYGGLEVAEVIRTQGIDQLRDDQQNAYLRMRGTKFNIPLDVRTPSYTDVCDAAQLNIPEMWNFEFWREYIDTLARYRYNYISLWNLHPFPSLVRVPEYPEVALDDVWRSRGAWQEHYSLEGRGFVTDEILENPEVVKSLTIDQKVDFWRKVMAYGKSRNVDFYIVTWNIFVYGTAAKYGITDDINNPTTIDYFRCSVRELFRTYPDLAGVGLTTGENMPDSSFREKEDWAMATYGQGVLDAAKAEPDRQITFIHRQHMAQATDIAKTFHPLIDQPNVDFLFSFKYAQAHVYSATQQPFHREFVRDLGTMRTIWTLRNDDIYYFRWGSPDFVREFVKNLPRDVSEGYYYGSDQYIWGREFLQRDAKGQGDLEIRKHWLQWLLWGRLAYDPTLANDRLVAMLATRFSLSRASAAQLLDAWQQASMIYPTTTGFHWGALDFQWYIEGCQSHASFAQNETGFHDVNRFITLKPHPESNCLSIPEFVDLKRLGGGFAKLTPLQVADRLDQYSNQAVTMLEQLESSDSAELRRTLADIRTIAHLGHYYADKIRGATQLAFARATEDPTLAAAAVSHLANAARHWHEYATLALAHHKNPLWTNRVGDVDWKQNYQYVLDDIRIAGGDPAKLDLPASIELEAEPVGRPYALDGR